MDEPSVDLSSWLKSITSAEANQLEERYFLGDVVRAYCAGQESTRLSDAAIASPYGFSARADCSQEFLPGAGVAGFRRDANARGV